MEENSNIKEIAKVPKKENENGKKRENIAFQIVAIFCIVIFALAITPRTFQNDTFYTIKVGQVIRENGIDFKDHFSWHTNSAGDPLLYMYPHWLYDVVMSKIYDAFGGFNGNGFQALYYATCICTALLGIAIYLTSRKITKSDAISLIFTLGQLYLVKPYVAARAQLVTFILFMLTIFFIEKFLDKPKPIYVIMLILIPIIIANVHSAVWPFYFVLYLPYIVEFAIAQIRDWHLIYRVRCLFNKLILNHYDKKLKGNPDNKELENKVNELTNTRISIDEEFKKYLENKEKNGPYKLVLEKNNHVPALVIIMLVCLFTGLLTPIKDMPYTYTYRTMQGNTTKNITEHQPLTLIDNKPILIILGIIIALTAFTKTKVKVRDVFFIAGLTVLALMSRRQISMLVLFAGLYFARLCKDLIDNFDVTILPDLKSYATTFIGEILIIFLVIAISYSNYKPIMDNSFIGGQYPVKACEWIKKNMDYKNMKIFNDYNYGSYLVLQDIPVYIDSRCDLYTPEFNGFFKFGSNDWKGGADYFTEYLDVSSIASYYDDVFNNEGIDYILIKSNSKLNMLIKKDTTKYKRIYNDGSFVIYHRLGTESRELNETDDTKSSKNEASESASDSLKSLQLNVVNIVDKNEGQ